MANANKKVLVIEDLPPELVNLAKECETAEDLEDAVGQDEDLSKAVKKQKLDLEEVFKLAKEPPPPQQPSAPAEQKPEPVLNKKKPYRMRGPVGLNGGNITYVQDGQEFGHDGKLLKIKGEPE